MASEEVTVDKVNNECKDSEVGKDGDMTVESLKRKYKWDWGEKLSGSPFRNEIKRLKEANKKKPSMKTSNNEFKRLLKAKEKELLVEFQMKCDKAKIWINNAHKEYNDVNEINGDDPQIAYQRKKEKIDTIDEFWAELLCHQTVFLQKHKIQRQKDKMNDLEKQTKELEKQLNAINNKKKGIVNETNQIQPKKQRKEKKKKKKKKKKDNRYVGLIGYFNKPQKVKKSKKKVSKIDKKQEKATETAAENINEKQVKMERKIEEKVGSEKEAKKAKKKVSTDKGSGSMKGGFLSAGTKGLYDDKKLDSELTVNERNIKNEKQIEEMGLKEATNNPLFTWTKPKDDGVGDDNKGNQVADPLTAYLDQQYKQGPAADKQ